MAADTKKHIGMKKKNNALKILTIVILSIWGIITCCQLYCYIYGIQNRPGNFPVRF